jgi:hypothetical protein
MIESCLALKIERLSMTPELALSNTSTANHPELLSNPPIIWLALDLR